MSTLYSNENPKIWNADTDEMETAKELQDAEVIQQAIEEGRALKQMANSSGYAILKTYLSATVEDLKNKLATESDYKKFRRLQEAVKAYNNVMVFVDFKIHEGSALELTRAPEKQE